MTEECAKGNHDLIEIDRAYYLYNEDHVVRWCRVCGSVVVDIEVDGRTVVGGIMKMISPQIAKTLV